MLMEVSLLQYLPASVHPPITVQNKSECVQECFYNKACVTMIYNTMSGNCYFSSSRATSAEAALNPVNSELVMINTDRGKLIVQWLP